jgi:hypothetical protein
VSTGAAVATVSTAVRPLISPVRRNGRGPMPGDSPFSVWARGPRWWGRSRPAPAGAPPRTRCGGSSARPRPVSSTRRGQPGPDRLVRSMAA